MLRCGYCEKICDNYEDWLSHLVSDEHQANLGVNDVFVKHNRDQDRNERSIIMHKMNPKTHPYEVVCHFASIEPLGFVTDVYIHIFPNVNEKFYLIVYDQRKFAQRVAFLHEKCGDQKVVTSLVNCKRKSSLTECEWNSKLEQSFFYRRHEYLKRKLTEMNWDTQLENLLKFISLDENGYQQRETVMEELESLLHEKFQEATVNPFGSCTTWLADVNADLDVFVDALGDKGRSELDSEKKLEIISSVTKMLRRKYDGKSVFPIRNARVPIIKLSHPSGLKVDISFENCLSVQNSKMIRLIAKLDYRVRRLLIFLRYWARYHNLIGPHSVKSYALIMMTFVYLRREKLVPSVHELQNIEGVNEYTVCGWNAAYCGSREVTYKHLPWLKACREPPSNEGICHEVMKLAYGFFKEYSTFDFDTQVICPLTGTYLPKASFDSSFGKDLPNEMGRLKANLFTSQCQPFPTKNKPICVQDPFALNVNVTASCTSQDVVTQLKAACSMAAEALKPFITSYGLAGTENFVELCCQPISESKKMEILMGASIDMTNHDNMAYVKTEATSSTHEDEWSREDNSTANAIAQAAAEDTRYRDDRPDKNASFEKDRNSRDADRYDSRKRDHHDRRDDSRPLRIQRISMFEDSKSSRDTRDSKFSSSYDQNQRYDLDRDREPTPPGESSSNKIKEEELEMKRKALKSTVVVAGKNTTSKSEVTSSLSPSSPFTSRVHGKAGWVQTSVELSSSSHPPQEKNKIENQSDGSSSANSAKQSASDQKCKKIKEIVVVVENKPPAREVTNFQNASISSAPIMYNQTVKFVIPEPERKKEPVVTFIHNQVKQTPPPQPTPPPRPPQPVLPPPVEEEYYEGEQEESEEDDDGVDELAEVDKFLHSLQQIAPPEESNVRFDAGANYGYEKVVKPQLGKQPVRTMAPYQPPQARNLGMAIGQQQQQQQQLTLPAFPNLNRQQMAAKPMLCFPAFCLFMNDAYQQKFSEIISSINIPETVKTVKMKVLWINAVTDIFTLPNFWSKFNPLYQTATFQEHKVKETKLVFEMAARRQVELLEMDAHHYTLINNDRKRKLDFESTLNNYSPQGRNINGPNSKMLKQDPAVLAENNPWEYQRRAELMVRLGKLPSNTRKSCATAFYFSCRPETMDLLYTHWQKLFPQLNSNATQSPLDLFGRLCSAVKTALPTQPNPTSADAFILSVRLLVAIDTGSEIPGVYFGFETNIPQDHPNWKLQEQFNNRFQIILKDLIPLYVNHRLLKYFKIK